MPLNAIKNYVKEELPVIYEAGKFIRDRAEDFNENREQVFEGVQQQLDGKDSTQINEEVRPIGSEAVLNGEPVFWSGQNYGWQSKGSFDKLMDEGQFRMGGVAAQRIGNSITEAIPQEVKDFATEKITDATTAAVDFYQDQNYETQQRINVGLNIANGVVTLADKGLEFISKTTNTSRFITDELAMAALTGGGSAAIRRATPAIKQGANIAGKSIARGVKKAFPLEGVDNIFPPTPPAALATAGSAPSVQLNVSGGKANLTPKVMPLTIKNEDRIAAGVRQGSAKSPRWKDAMREWGSRRAQLREQLETAVAQNKSRSAIDAIKDIASNDVSTGPTRFADNPVAYKVDEFKEQSVIKPLTAKGNTSWQQQHHLFPKQESYQFIEAMNKLGDDDDVLNMFLYAEDMDAALGGRLFNMLNMEDLPHSVLHSSRSRKIDGRQLQAIKMKNLVESAKTSDELMDIFHDYIVNNIQPSKNQAYALKEIGKRLNKQGRFESLDILREKNFMGKNPKK